jgi:hypothetical protein
LFINIYFLKDALCAKNQNSNSHKSPKTILHPIINGVKHLILTMFVVFMSIMKKTALFGGLSDIDTVDTAACLAWWAAAWPPTHAFMWRLR